MSDTAHTEPKTDYPKMMILGDTLRLINTQAASKKKKQISIQRYTILTLALTNLLSASITGFTVYLACQVKTQQGPTTVQYAPTSVEKGPAMSSKHGPSIRRRQEYNAKHLPAAVEKIKVQSLQRLPVTIDKDLDELQGIPGIGGTQHNYTVHIDLDHEREESEETSWWNE